MKDDLISRQDVLDIIQTGAIVLNGIDGDLDLVEKTITQTKQFLAECIEELPSAETHDKRTETHACDCISRQAAIDALDCISGVEEVLRSLPSAQP